MVVGTPSYMAPEKVSGGAAEVDQKAADIWSFGCTGKCMVVGDTLGLLIKPPPPHRMFANTSPAPLQCWSWPVANARGQKQASRTHTSCLHTCARLAVALVSRVCLACCLFAQTLPVDTSSPIPSETAVPTANQQIPSRPSCANSWRPACWWTLQSASPQPSCWSCPL